MEGEDIHDLIEQKLARYKGKLQNKELQLNTLLEITNAINQNLSTLEVLDRYKSFVKDNLKIEMLVLYSKGRKWSPMLDYGVSDSTLDKIDVEADLLSITTITSINTIKSDHLKDFDMIVPVLRGDQPIAYLLLGDVEEEALSVSAIIKHLNFLQVLTNIVVSAIENQRLAQEALKQEKEKQELIRRQNEMLEQQVAVRTSELRMEKEESERLLNNILPKAVADELKSKGSIAPRKYESASMLFTDFKSFTSQASKMKPADLVNELDDIFRNFDRIVEKWSLEKIKTIGDSYMAGCGLPDENKLHAAYCIMAGKEMLSYLKTRARKAKIKWEMRVGVNSGPLVAGVVGARKFTYDVWGDTVNTASRMESNGEPGKVNITSATHKIVKDLFECKYRGKLTAKGKGEIDMYFAGKSLKKIKPPERVVTRDGTATIAKLRNLIIRKLKEELPANLSYHNVDHTLDVFEAARKIGAKENITGIEFELLQAAALFHDAGFVKKYKGHEEESCNIVRTILPGYQYSAKEIDTICSIIMATKVPQRPKNHVEKIICDADLDYLGRDDFWETGNGLLKELQSIGQKLTEIEWNKLQEEFLEKHTYFTDAARTMREPMKLKRIEELKGRIREADGI